ncbi:MAG TPA: methyl-accepting chemotaxis protein [Bryobacteraceae bacterium]|nr:methyl-accepting chemotaxis protein [Bryobacteraceae bacterium]
MPERIIALSQQLSSVATRRVEDIRQVTRMTKILALNAAIKAARAGESGTGFAIVSSEAGLRHRGRRVCCKAARYRWCCSCFGSPWRDPRFLHRLSRSWITEVISNGRAAQYPLTRGANVGNQAWFRKASET